MATEIRMPAFSSSMTEGSLAKWLKKEGDDVKAGEAIAEVETDKAIVELESTADGVLGKIVVDEGAPPVPVDGLVAVIVARGEAAPDVSVKSNGAASASVVASTPATPAVPAENSANGAQHGNRIFASPLARRIAKDGSVDLATIDGSGPHGRIVRRDVEAALKGKQPVAAATPAAISASTPVIADGVREFEEVPHTPMRRVIAQRLTESKQSVPHFYLTVDCAIDELLALRKEINDGVEGVKLSVNDFIVKAVGIALKRVPAANASWTDSALRRYKHVDVSVAVATPSGLITPVVQNVDNKTLSAIASEIKELAGRARESRLKPHEYQGGGFTISNLGMYGISQFAAIINPPQACILAVGSGEQRPIVKGGQLTVATMMTCTLSVDHRVVDGAVGAEFLAAFKSLIEKPFGMLV